MLWNQKVVSPSPFLFPSPKQFLFQARKINWKLLWGHRHHRKSSICYIFGKMVSRLHFLPSLLGSVYRSILNGSIILLTPLWPKSLLLLPSVAECLLVSFAFVLFLFFFQSWQTRPDSQFPCTLHFHNQKMCLLSTSYCVLFPSLMTIIFRL